MCGCNELFVGSVVFLAKLSLNLIESQVRSHVDEFFSGREKKWRSASVMMIVLGDAEEKKSDMIPSKDAEARVYIVGQVNSAEKGKRLKYLKFK